MSIDERIVIGVDIGTTFSGGAWAFSRRPNDIELITNWESARKYCSDQAQVPTVVYYDENGIAVGWGLTDEEYTEKVQWMKLLLLDDKDVPAHVAASEQFAELKKLQKKLGKTGVEMLADFTRHLWQHIISSIRRSLGIRHLNLCEIYVVLTIPAIWPLYAQERMREVARRAGIEDQGSFKQPPVVKLISEPEAGALATIQDFSKTSSIEVGDKLVLCDAGGGTVDLISYAVTSVQPFEVEECVKGGGGLCGAIFLDDRFLSVIRNEVGSQWWKALSTAEKDQFLNDSWEHHIKPQFRGRKKSWLVDVLAGALKKGTRKRQRNLQLSGDKVLTVFDPIITRIEALVKEQADAIQNLSTSEPKYLVLVGGFGRNAYLYDRLQKAFPDVEVLQSQGSKPWSAICRGAVIHGLLAASIPGSFSVAVKTRVSRRNCGIQISRPWEEGQGYAKEDKYFCHTEETHMVKNQMDWHIKVDDKLDSSAPHRHSYRRTYKRREDAAPEIIDQLYLNYSAEPPSRKDDTVQSSCTIMWKWTNSNAPLIKSKTASGNIFYTLEYEIETTHVGGAVEYNVYYDGKKMTDQSVRVHFDD